MPCGRAFQVKFNSAAEVSAESLLLRLPTCSRARTQTSTRTSRCYQRASPSAQGAESGVCLTRRTPDTNGVPSRQRQKRMLSVVSPERNSQTFKSLAKQRRTTASRCRGRCRLRHSCEPALLHTAMSRAPDVSHNGCAHPLSNCSLNLRSSGASTHEPDCVASRCVHRGASAAAV